MLLAACPGKHPGSHPDATRIPPGLYSGRTATGARIRAAFGANGAFLMSFSPTSEARDTCSLWFGSATMKQGAFEATQVHGHALPGMPQPFMAQAKLLGSYAGRQVTGRITSGPTTTEFQLTCLPGPAAPPSLGRLQGAYTDTLKIFRNSLPANFVHSTLSLRIGPDGKVEGAIARPGSAPGPLRGFLRPRPDFDGYDAVIIVAQDEELDPLDEERAYKGLAFYDPETRGFQFAVRSDSGSALGFFARGPQ
jgi:hypothetical protein